MIKNRPPMGWNSWDCFGAAVTEEEVIANADYMAEYMKNYGWEYIVVDIQWYEPKAVSSAYNSFYPLCMDEFSRLMPAENRFPSSKNGKGFKPLADYVHSLGLKFGIHIMRGIPRQAVHNNTPIKGTDITAREIAHPNSICAWNTDMYGVDSSKAGAQTYYDSLIELYSEWGVDFLKVDDIARPYSEGEIELIQRAIKRSNREIVLSLSPGPAPIEEGEHLSKHANMWRMTDDFWDTWSHLYPMFDKCKEWSSYVGEGAWPDADMLPLGHIGIKSVEHGVGDRWTRFTKDEQVMMLTLWTIFRSPLMMGGHMPDNDEWTLNLLTNEEVLRVVKHSRNARELFRNGHFNTHIAWVADDAYGGKYLALFNIGNKVSNLEVSLEELELEGNYMVRDLWKKEDLYSTDRFIKAEVNPHGAILLKLNKKEND